MRIYWILNGDSEKISENQRQKAWTRGCPNTGTRTLRSLDARKHPSRVDAQTFGGPPFHFQFFAAVGAAVAGASARCHGGCCKNLRKAKEKQKKNTGKIHKSMCSQDSIYSKTLLVSVLVENEQLRYFLAAQLKREMWSNEVSLLKHQYYLRPPKMGTRY